MFELHYSFLVIYSSVKTKKKPNIRSFCCKKIWGEDREGEGKGRSDDRAKLIQKMKLLYNMGSTM